MSPRLAACSSDVPALDEALVQLTKHGHACVVLSDGDRRLVVDPGAFTADDAWTGASGLLVTHEHATTSSPTGCVPWSKTAELIDHLREVRAGRALAVHDGLLNDTGLGLLAGLLGERGPGQPTPYARLAPGESVTV